MLSTLVSQAHAADANALLNVSHILLQPVKAIEVHWAPPPAPPPAPVQPIDESCSGDADDIFVVVLLELLCWMFLNPITSMCISATVFGLVILLLGVSMGASYNKEGRLCCESCRCFTNMGRRCCCLRCCQCCKCCRCCIHTLVDELGDDVFVEPSRWCDCSCCKECGSKDDGDLNGRFVNHMGIAVKARSKSAKAFKVVPVKARPAHAPVEVVYAMFDFEDVSLFRFCFVVLQVCCVCVYDVSDRSPSHSPVSPQQHLVKQDVQKRERTKSERLARTKSERLERQRTMDSATENRVVEHTRSVSEGPATMRRSQSMSRRQRSRGRMEYDPEDDAADGGKEAVRPVEAL